MTDTSASLATSSGYTILVVGGTGETGRRILHALRRRHPELRLHYASRTAAAAGLLPADILHVPLDLTRPELVGHVFRGYSLVVLAMGPTEAFGARIHTLCMQAGADCVDINDNLHVAQSVYALHDQACAAGRRIYTGMGLSPGLSSLMLMELADEHASSAGVYRCRLYMGAGYGGGKTSPYAMLDNFSSRCTGWFDNRLQSAPTPWRDGRHLFQFPGHAQALELIPYSSPEAAGLAALAARQAQSIRDLDSRFHVQYLTQRFARTLARWRLSPRQRDFFAGMFYRSGQSMKQRKDADPDTCVWVYPDDSPERGLVLHGVISSYDLTALTACALIDAYLAQALPATAGVFSMETLPASVRQWLTQDLASYGVCYKRTSLATLVSEQRYFGWSRVSQGEVGLLPHFGQNWYSVPVQHPRMMPLQKTFLLDSALWRALKSRLGALGLARFVVRFMWRWKRHHRQLAEVRERGPAIYTPLTRDISMFTAGYSSARDVLGQAQALPLYRQMFLDTGAMEMNWLWPSAELLATLENPAMGVLAYWRAFLHSYQADGVLTFVERERDDGSVLFSLSHCLYASLFAELGCPELSPLIRDMEHAALLEMSRNSGVHIDWQTGEAGYATVKMVWPSHSLTQEAASSGLPRVSQKWDG
ncbi:hypothetical protein BXU06_11780 [Aquaspirillum sp. LM1]|uniref:saccharopine dehydrogenase NADP-binding domain-containing protein n=1 Tax=Aquaspirillum sp. LM1 TaxID=1938604 RepID=UPI000983E2E8|nr:saccharopine dehydrogenase NADP-binding domain-containing protein [Aquaspirillum sp. LM1]AQR65654.1 hypothetical protein BXU06_11780 [Aquaspirillum sp. LM1]